MSSIFGLYPMVPQQVVAVTSSPYGYTDLYQDDLVLSYGNSPFPIMNPTTVPTSFSPSFFESQNLSPFAPAPVITSETYAVQPDRLAYIQKNVTKYYYYKLVDKWLLNGLSDFLNYFTIDENKRVRRTKYDPNNVKSDTDETAELKANYIGKKIITKEGMFRILSKFIQKNQLRWNTLAAHEYSLIKYLKKVLAKKLD